MFGSLFDSVVNTAEKLIDSPVETVIDIATQPVRDGLDVLSGLTEGELRVKAAARLGADISAGMAASELIEFLSQDD